MTRTTPISLAILLVVGVLCVASCGEDAQRPGPPAWPELSKEQHDEAERLGVPVKFENDLGMRYVLIPSGTFLMGSPEDEEGRLPGERLHEVTLTSAYYVQTTEVTNEQYRTWRRDHDSGAWSGHSLNGERQPVVNLLWEDACNFARWLSKREGRLFLLPTEAEWERACRAGTQTRFWWGDSEEEAYRYANGNDPVTQREAGLSRDAFPRDDGHRVAAPVGSYLPNGWGLYDMHGNVWEWCAHRRLERDASGGAAAPPECTPKRTNPFRGGSWADMPRVLRAANDNGGNRGARFRSVGFRLVAPLPEQGK